MLVEQAGVYVVSREVLWSWGGVMGGGAHRMGRVLWGGMV